MNPRDDDFESGSRGARKQPFETQSRRHGAGRSTCPFCHEVTHSIHGRATDDWDILWTWISRPMNNPRRQRQYVTRPRPAWRQANICNGTQEIQSLLSQLAVETRIQYGAQRFLESLTRDDSFVPEHEREGLRRKVEDELDACERKMASLKRRVRELQGETQESSEVDAREITGELRGMELGRAGQHYLQRPIAHAASSSTLASNFTSSSPSHTSSVFLGPQSIRQDDASRRRAHSNATIASNVSNDRKERVVYAEPDQMSVISSSESGPMMSKYPKSTALATSPSSQMRQSRQDRVESYQTRNPPTSRSRSRQGSFRTDTRPPVPTQQYSSTSVEYSLENMDALSQLANAVASSGFVRRHSLSLDSTSPLDVHSPIVSNSSDGPQPVVDTTHTHAEKEERRRREYEEALKVARGVITGLETLHQAPLESTRLPTYGLAQRRTTGQSVGADEETPSAARRYASFMRNEGLQQSSSSDTSRVKQPGISGSPAKLIALLTRCLKMYPDILSGLDFNHMVDM